MNQQQIGAGGGAAPAFSYRDILRKHRKFVAQKNFAAGGSDQIQIPQVGLAAELVLMFEGTYSQSGTGTVTKEGWAALLKKIRISMNNGSVVYWDTSGFGAARVQNAYGPGYGPDLAGAGSVTVDSDTFADATILTGAQAGVAFRFQLRLKLNLNDGLNFTTGLVPLQSVDSYMYLNLDYGALLDLSSTCTGVTGTFTIDVNYYDYPPAGYPPPPIIICRTTEQIKPFAATGDIIDAMPRGGTLIQLLQGVCLNGSYATQKTAVSQFQWRYNLAEYSDLIIRRALRAQNRFDLETDLPAGWYLHNFFQAQGLVNSGDFRDSIDTEENTMTELITSVDSTATVTGVTHNRYISRVVQLPIM